MPQRLFCCHVYRLNTIQETQQSSFLYVFVRFFSLDSAQNVTCAWCKNGKQKIVHSRRPSEINLASMFTPLMFVGFHNHFFL